MKVLQRISTGLLLVLALAGCAGQVQMMPRDSGKIYTGAVQVRGIGSGTISIMIEGDEYTGPVVRMPSSATFGFFQQYGASGVSSSGSIISSGSTANVKGILSSANGRGLRCEFNSDGGSGAGICVDDKSRVYDAVVSR